MIELNFFTYKTNNIRKIIINKTRKINKDTDEFSRKYLYD